MSSYDVTLLGRREIAERTMEHRFTWPEGFAFKAGQAAEFILPEPAGGHAFSLVNAPHQQELVIATRMRDSVYKRALGALPIGAPAKVDGPFGSLTLHKNPSRAAVLIAGGIGITPFMSIVRSAMKERLAHPMALVYSNRRARDAAYLAELQEAARSHGKLRLVTTMTEDGGGLVDAAMIQRAAEGLPAPIFYVAGPPAMVEAMKAALENAGVEDTDVRSEEFFGYESAVPVTS
jgi:ferredoxin-NADP reductase